LNTLNPVVLYILPTAIMESLESEAASWRKDFYRLNVLSVA